jgi:hypothetical protein
VLDLGPGERSNKMDVVAECRGIALSDRCILIRWGGIYTHGMQLKA